MKGTTTRCPVPGPRAVVEHQMRMAPVLFKRATIDKEDAVRT